MAEGDKLSLGKHELTFVMAPMVHWPEVMMEYESTDKVLFSADGFGKFGALDTDEDWTCEARRYYFNIVGKYGAQVQAVLKKAAGLDIEKICPLHGSILTENLGFYIDKYNTWSSYQPEDEGILVACASIHGNTKKAAERSDTTGLCSAHAHMMEAFSHQWRISYTISRQRLIRIVRLPSWKTVHGLLQQHAR